MKFKLKPDNRNASDEELFEDLLRVARKLGLQSITMRDYNKIGRFHSATIANRFGGWNIALEKAGLETGKQSNISNEELIADIKRVALEIAPLKLTQNLYNEKGKYTSQTIRERFGWNRALRNLNLEIYNVNITEKELFVNLEKVWINLGRVPGRRDMVKPLSKYSETPYRNRYGSWRKALEAFVDYINSDSKEVLDADEIVPDISESEKGEVTYRHKTKRDISDRLKVRVLIRDGNKCKLCGITVTGENIHFDHIKPWSKRGETVVENIQVLCAKHNLAKGDFYEEN